MNERLKEAVEAADLVVPEGGERLALAAAHYGQVFPDATIRRLREAILERTGGRAVSWFPEVGDTFGRYRITGVLGHGGMGVVFAAVAEDLDRPVALKVLAPQAAVDPRLRERFAREAATLARLDSPHIVYILEYGEHEGCLYLVTQLIPGGDLRQYLDEHGPLPPRQAADVMRAGGRRPGGGALPRHRPPRPQVGQRAVAHPARR